MHEVKEDHERKKEILGARTSHNHFLLPFTATLDRLAEDFTVKLDRLSERGTTQP